MTTDVAVRINGQTGQPSTALAIRPGQDVFDDKQRAALAALGIRDASNADLAVYMHYCQKTGLDPFSKQIYMIGRREKRSWRDERGKWQEEWVTKQTIQVGIEGFRVIRDRAARRDGVTVEYENTVWYDASGGAHRIWLSTDAPAGCEVTVLKDGRRFPAVLTFAEYVQTNSDGRPTGKWGTAPAHQIEKCAEAYALRRAFPHDLGGIYIEEEMAATAELAAQTAPARQHRITTAEVLGHDDSPPTADTTPQSSAASAADDTAAEPVRSEPRIASGQIGIIGSHGKRLGFEAHETQEFINLIAVLAGVPDLADISDLTQEQGRQVQQRLSKCPDRDTLIKWAAPPAGNTE